MSRTLASDELARAGRWKRFQIRLHLLMCRHCRGYAAQLREMGEAVRLLVQGEEDAAQLERLRQAVLLRLPPDGDCL